MRITRTHEFDHWCYFLRLASVRGILTARQQGKKMGRGLYGLLFLVAAVGRDAFAAEILVGSGFRTLESALKNASNADTLRIQPGVYRGAGYCGLVVDVPVTVVGNEQVVIDCEGQSRIMNVQASSTFDGITFKNGKSPGE